MQFLFELLLEPIFEGIFYGIGYVTAWVVVPLFTFGHVTVEFARTRSQRIAPRRYVIEGEMAACIGWLFWIIVAVVVWLLHK